MILAALAITFVVAAFVVLMFGIWIGLASQTAAPIPDEPQTLDVQNHRGD